MDVRAMSNFGRYSWYSLFRSYRIRLSTPLLAHYLTTAFAFVPVVLRWGAIDVGNLGRHRVILFGGKISGHNAEAMAVCNAEFSLESCNLAQNR